MCLADTHDYLHVRTSVKLFDLLSRIFLITFQLHFRYKLDAQQCSVGNNFIIIIFYFFSTLLLSSGVNVCEFCVRRKWKISKINVIVIFYGRVVSLPSISSCIQMHVCNYRPLAPTFHWIFRINLKGIKWTKISTIMSASSSRFFLRSLECQLSAIFCQKRYEARK